MNNSHLNSFIKTAISQFETAKNKIKNDKLNGSTISEIISEKLKSINNNQDLNINNIINNAFSYSSQRIDNLFNNVDPDLKDIKDHLIIYFSKDSEEDLIIVSEYLVSKIIDNKEFNSIQELIGEENFKLLLSIVVTHSIRIIKTVYDYASEKINLVEMRDKIKSLYNTYIVQIIDFIKNGREKYAPDIINFAFGNKGAAILSIVSKMTIDVLREKDKHEKFMEGFNHILKKVSNGLSRKKRTEILNEKDYSPNIT